VENIFFFIVWAQDVYHKYCFIIS